MRQDLVDASLRKKGGKQEQEKIQEQEQNEGEGQVEASLIPSFQSFEQQDILAQVRPNRWVKTRIH